MSKASGEPHVGSTNLKNVFASKVRENFQTITGAEAPAQLDDIVRGLEAHFLKGDLEQLGQCDLCLGWSPVADLEACPYCNDEEIINAEVASPTDAAKPATRKKLPDDSATAAPSLALVKASAAPLMNIDVHETDDALARVIPHVEWFATAPVSEETLDQLSGAIRVCDREHGRSAWLLGQLLVHFCRFWQQRTDENGKPKYKTMAQALRDEFGITSQHALRLRKVAVEHTREDIERVGTTRLYALLSLPAKERAALLASGAADRMSTSEIKALPKPGKPSLAQAVENARVTGVAAREASGTTLPETRETKTNVRAAAITFAAKALTGTLAMEAKTDDALLHCTIPGLNDVQLRLTLNPKTNELSFAFTRDEESTDTDDTEEQGE